MRIAASLVLLSVVTLPLAQQASAQRPLATKPDLGAMTVSPSKATPGQLVTITGKTRNVVQFLPPLVQVRSARTAVVHMPAGPCGGTQHMPIAFKTVGSGGGTGTGGKKTPPAGTVWKVKFRVPKNMNGLDASGHTFTFATQPGKYYIDAIGVGIDACVFPTKSSKLFSVGKLTILQPPPVPARP